MNRLINILLIGAVISLLLAMVAKQGVFAATVYYPVTFWRFSMSCLTFAISLALLQIRDKK